MLFKKVNKCILEAPIDLSEKLPTQTENDFTFEFSKIASEKNAKSNIPFGKNVEPTMPTKEERSLRKVDLP